jgi:hypothetical protein
VKHRFRKRPILLSALLTLAILSPPQLALCVGDGGHQELELLSAECCPPEAAHAEHDGLDDDCAERCIDTPLGSTNAASISSRATNAAPDLSLSSHAVATLPAAGLTEVVARASHGRDGPCYIARRSDLSARSTILRL